MLVPKFAFEVACAPGFASYMDDDVPWDTRSYVRKARPNSIALEKGEFRNTHARYYIVYSLHASISSNLEIIRGQCRNANLPLIKNQDMKTRSLELNLISLHTL